MPRTKITALEASARNAKKHNQRQRTQYPLYMQAGLEEQLKQFGMIRDRPDDAALRSHEDLKARLDQLEQLCRTRAALYSRTLMQVDHAAWARELLHLRRLRQRFPSMRRFVNQADHWHTALRGALTREAYLAFLDDHDPEYAGHLRLSDATVARLKEAQRRGSYNPW